MTCHIILFEISGIKYGKHQDMKDKNMSYRTGVDIGYLGQLFFRV